MIDFEYPTSRVVKRLLSKKLYTLNLVSAVTLLLGIVGFFQFLPKYLESVLHQVLDGGRLDRRLQHPEQRHRHHCLRIRHVQVEVYGTAGHRLHGLRHGRLVSWIYRGLLPISNHPISYLISIL